MGKYEENLTFCPICESKDWKSIRKYRGKSELFLNIKLLSCTACSFVFASPLPNDTDLAVYNSSYFLNAHGGQSTHPIAIAFHSGINKIRANYIAKILNETSYQPSKILEIGPGLGFMIEFFKDKFPELEYSIIESDIENLEKLKKKITNSYSEIDKARDENFDLIILSHVLEHMNDPLAFLKKVKSKLKPGGYIFIEVPNEDYKFKKEDEPHLLFFNQDSMKTLLTKANLNCVKISNHGPEVEQRLIDRFIFKLYSFLDHKLYKIGIQLPIYFLLPSLRKLLSSREILSVFPFDALKDKKNPSWWLRVVAQKS